MNTVNINVAKARTILGMVAGSTTVDESYLLEDQGFCDLLTEYAHKLTLNDAIARLETYVNDNY